MSKMTENTAARERLAETMARLEKLCSKIEQEINKDE